MVNNITFIKQRVFILFAFVFLFCIKSNAQSINKYLVSHVNKDGILYFIKQNNEWEGDKSSFYYDLTYNSAQDSIIVNYTINHKKSFRLKKLKLNSKTDTLIGVSQKLYINIDKNDIIYRYSSKFLFEDFFKIINKNNFSWSISSETSTEDQYSLSKRKLRKHNEVLGRIFTLISLNK